jgi:hypothetical protein
MRGRQVVRWVRSGAAIALVAFLGSQLAGCSDDLPTELGGDLRTPPESLRDTTLTAIAEDSAYAIPVSLGRAVVGQVGAQAPYESHILFDFRIPTRVVSGSDTLRLDDARLALSTDSLLVPPFTGSMRLRLFEVDSIGRGWSADSLIDDPLLQLPPLESDPVARDTVLVGADLDLRVVRLGFDLLLDRIRGYAAARDTGGTLEVNLALVFDRFETPGKGFLEIPFIDITRREKAQLIGFSDEQSAAMVTVTPRRRRPVAEVDSTYTPGNKLVVSDGYRFHSFVKFASLRTVLPEAALVYAADLLVTQVDTLSGTSFGSAIELGVIVPPDTLVYSQAVNNREPDHRGAIAPDALSTTTIPVTGYILFQQEGDLPNRGMILALPNEGTRIRHFEFFGGTAPDSLRPRLRIVWGIPPGFETRAEP